MKTSAGVYQTKVNNLLKEKSTPLSIGMFTVFFILAGILMVTNPKRISVAEIERENREAFLNQQNNKPSIYTVQEGEGLWQIAEKTTGDGENWTKIAAANNITNPDTISAGQKLNIPANVLGQNVTGAPTPTIQPTASVEPSPTPAPEQGQIDGGMTQKANPSIKEYTLQEGEGLWQAAEKVYGDGNMWTKIAEANNIQNPDSVFVGMKLIMPSL